MSAINPVIDAAAGAAAHTAVRPAAAPLANWRRLMAGRPGRNAWLDARRVWSVVLMGALVLSQALGLIHGVVHAPGQAATAHQAGLAGVGQRHHDVHVAIDDHAHAHNHAHEHAQDHRHGRTPARAASAWTTQSAEPVAPSGWLARLFAGAEHADHCPLYDQLSHADGVPRALAVDLCNVLTDALPPWHGPSLMAAQAAGYLARGPPREAHLLS